MKIAVAATPAVAIPTLNWLQESDHELAFIISQPDAPAGRGRSIAQTPVSQWANTHGVLLYKPSKIAEVREALSQVDLLLTIGYGQLLPEEVFCSPQLGSLNLHFSLLPRWRGAAPVQRALEANDSVTGVTVFQLDAGMDTGPIYQSLRFALDSDISADQLFDELAEVGREAVEQTLMDIARGVKPKAQSADGVTRAYKLTKEQGHVNWSRPAEEVSAHIRAFTTNPGAWTLVNGQVLKVQSPAMAELHLEPGEIRVRKTAVLIGTQTSALEIGTVIPQGKAHMSAVDWARGARLQGGEICG